MIYSAMVSTLRIELSSTVLQTAAMTTSAKLTKLLPSPRIKLGTNAYKAIVISLNYKGFLGYAFSNNSRTT